MIAEEKYLVAYFGRQSDFYLENYRKYTKDDKFTFNIGTFLAGFFWFLYRKLFLEILLIMLFLFGIGIIQELIFYFFDVGEDVQRFVDLLFTFVFATLNGFVGNRIYFRKAERTIFKVLQQTESEDERIELLKRKGGVSWIPYLFIFIVIIVFYLINNIS